MFMTKSAQPELKKNRSELIAWLRWRITRPVVSIYRLPNRCHVGKPEENEAHFQTCIARHDVDTKPLRLTALCLPGPLFTFAWQLQQNKECDSSIWAAKQTNCMNRSRNGFITAMSVKGLSICPYLLAVFTPMI